jgi:hypothetical protein
VSDAPCDLCVHASLSFSLSLSLTHIHTITHTNKSRTHAYTHSRTLSLNGSHKTLSGAQATAAAIPFATPTVDVNGFDNFGDDDADPNRPPAPVLDADGNPLPADTRARRPTESTPQPLTLPDHTLHQLELMVPGAWQTIDRHARATHSHGQCSHADIGPCHTHTHGHTHAHTHTYTHSLTYTHAHTHTLSLSPCIVVWAIAGVTVMRFGRTSTCVRCVRACCTLRRGGDCLSVWALRLRRMKISTAKAGCVRVHRAAYLPPPITHTHAHTHTYIHTHTYVHAVCLVCTSATAVLY